MDSPSTPKKQKLSPAPSTPAGTPAGTQKPSEEEEDPDAVPPASTAGAHAKPLAALHAGPSGVGMLGKGKGKAKRPQEKEGFESVLERLQDDGASLSHPRHRITAGFEHHFDGETTTKLATVDSQSETLTVCALNRRERRGKMGSTSSRQNRRSKGFAR